MQPSSQRRNAYAAHVRAEGGPGAADPDDRGPGVQRDLVLSGAGGGDVRQRLPAGRRPGLPGVLRPSRGGRHPGGGGHGQPAGLGMVLAGGL